MGREDERKTIDLFWDMFIIDALIANFDRHGSNWGFIKKDNRYRLSPIFDNGSGLFPQLNTDEKMEAVLRNQEEIDMRIYKFPTSQVMEDFTSGMLSTLQYGDKIIVDSMEAIAGTTAGFTEAIFTIVTNGVDIISQNLLFIGK